MLFRMTATTLRDEFLVGRALGINVEDLYEISATWRFYSLIRAILSKKFVVSCQSAEHTRGGGCGTFTPIFRSSGIGPVPGFAGVLLQLVSLFRV